MLKVSKILVATGTGAYALSPELRKYLREGILECVEEAYSWYASAKKTRERVKEPAISVGYLFDWFATNKGWGPLDDAKRYTEGRERAIRYEKKILKLQIRSMLGQLCSQGHLTSSLGFSDSGRDARLYEPSKPPVR